LLVELAFSNPVGFYAYLPLIIVSLLADLSSGVPKLINTLSEKDNMVLQKMLTYFLNADGQQKLAIIKSYFNRLFDFPLSTKNIHLQKVAGTFSVKTSGSMAITQDDLSLYDVSIEYETPDENGQAMTRDIHLNWKENDNKITDNSIPFSFSKTQLIIPAVAFA